MATRTLRLLGAGRTNRDERQLPPAQRRGDSIVVRVISEDLKAQPVHEIELSPERAIELAQQLLAAVHTQMTR